MKRRSQLAVWFAVLMLALQVVSACASGGSEPNATSGAPSTSASSGSAVPLDAQSSSWFDALCPGLTQATALLSGVGGTATTVSQQDIVGAVRQASTVIDNTATRLATLPPPTFAGGAQVATGVVGAMQSAATQMTTSAATFAAIDPGDAAALQAGRTSLQTELLTSLGFLRDLGRIDPAVTSEIAKIPSCSALTR